jgi:ribosomal protein S18 acetylase RimI-like enzyme
MTLVAEARPAILPGLPAGFTIREPEVADAERLGRLYFESDVPGATCRSAAEAITEIRSCFQGEFGDLWSGASGLIEHGSDLVAALLAVHRAPWDDTPDCPFITDLFTDHRFRRQGLARALLVRCLTRTSMIDGPCLALRVDSANKAAIRLYESVGFHPNG